MANEIATHLAALVGIVGLGACASDSTGTDRGSDLGTAPASAPDGDHDDDDDDDDDDNGCESLDAQIVRARAATEKYKDEALAIKNGFLPTDACVSHPADGTMGLHYVNPALVDQTLIIEEPEVLLYIEENGVRRLTAIEYLLPIMQDGAPYMGCGVDNNSCPPRELPAAPKLFEGISFHGPMAGHNPMMPWHYELHVWLFETNPGGIFAQWNPNLSCDTEECPDEDDPDHDHENDHH